MSRTSTMMTRIVPPRPASSAECDQAARDQGALHALHILPR
ncbi:MULTISPECIES: hypothetical protein [unclassified Microbacterium]|nr:MULTISPECIES: hypothetical protein [unclassified Microbacterium]